MSSAGATKLWHKYSEGQAASLLNVTPTAASGSEIVFMGGGYSVDSIYSSYVLSLYKISNLDGATTQNNIYYNAGGYYTDVKDY